MENSSSSMIDLPHGDGFEGLVVLCKITRRDSENAQRLRPIMRSGTEKKMKKS